MWGEVGGQTWERLGREVGGRVGYLVTGRKEVGGKRMEDLVAVWEITERGWEVDGERFLKRDGEEEGWKRIKEIIQFTVTGNGRKCGRFLIKQVKASWL